jgi:hypothetical protein
MVRQQYPEMTNARRVEFGLANQRGAHALVQIFFFAAAGSARSFLFGLTNEEDAWRISGVEETESYPEGERLGGTHA